MNRHQVITGASNSGDHCVAVGSVESINFTVCIVTPPPLKKQKLSNCRAGVNIGQRVDQRGQDVATIPGSHFSSDLTHSQTT